MSAGSNVDPLTEIDAAEISPEVVAEWIFREDCAAWWEAFGWIAKKKGVIEQPVTNYLQSILADVKREFRKRGMPVRILTLKPRQKGSTTYSAADMYHEIRRKRTSACVIGAQYSQTQNAFDTMRLYSEMDKFPWRNNGTIGQKEGRWSNGSKLVQETAGDGEAGRSGTFQYLLVTEAARWAEQGVKDASKVMAGILKCVSQEPDTTIIIETTAKAASGDFYERWDGAIDAADFLAGKPITAGTYVRCFAPWFEFIDSVPSVRISVKEQQNVEDSLDTNPNYLGEKEVLNEFGWRDKEGVMRLGKSCSAGRDTGQPTWTAWEQLAWRRLTIDTECSKDVEKFNQDFPESWQKAFLRGGRSRFNKAGMAWQRQQARKMRPQYGVIDSPEEARMGDASPVVWRPCDEDEGWIVRYEQVKDGCRYLLSIDNATGASQTGGKDPDCHSVLVLRAGYYEHGRGWTPAAVVARIKAPCRWDLKGMLDKRIWALAKLYGGKDGCMIVPEVNKEGGLIENLRAMGATIYRRKTWNQVENRETEQYGWLTSGGPNTGGGRDRSIEALAQAIREFERDGDGININDPHIIKECESFIIMDNGKAEADHGCHDDDVLSLSIGMACINSATAYIREDYREQRNHAARASEMDRDRDRGTNFGSGSRAWG